MLPLAKITKAVVPAAGFGTRLRPLTNAFPKELLPIGRKPVLAYVVDELRTAGVTDILFVVSERKPQIRAFLGEVYGGEDGLPPARCSYVVQQAQRGSGDAVLCAEEWANGEPFLVAFGDCILDAPENGSAPLQRLIAAHTQNGAGATVMVEAIPKEKVGRYGVVAPAETLPASPTDSFALRGIVEKPTPEEAPSNLVVAARFALQPEIFEVLHALAPDKRGEQNLPDAMTQLLTQGLPLWATPLRSGEARRDIGNFETFFANFTRFALRDPEFGDAVRQAFLEEEPQTL
jgi:UTP--glucose-1-phosphate uridylyltransferase